VRLYRSGLTRQILLDEDVTRAVVLSLGIPPQDVAAFGSGLKNTHEEACAVAQWVRKNKYRRISIPTEIFPSRRVRWIFTHALKGSGVQVLIDTYPTAEYTEKNWWLHQAGSDQFRTEFVKYLFYRLRYSFTRC
jgi:uncharacterized SAM-binding protein YcdF (DUF218 family)